MCVQEGSFLSLSLSLLFHFSFLYYFLSLSSFVSLYFQSLFHLLFSICLHLIHCCFLLVCVYLFRSVCLYFCLLFWSFCFSLFIERYVDKKSVQCRCLSMQQCFVCHVLKTAVVERYFLCQKMILKNSLRFC